MEHTCSPSSQTVDLASLDLESSRGSTSDTPSVLNSCVASATSVHQSKLTVEVSCRAGRGESKFRRVAGTCKCAARRVKAFQHNINATRRENKGALATEMACFALTIPRRQEAALRTQRRKPWRLLFVVACNKPNSFEKESDRRLEV